MTIIHDTTFMKLSLYEYVKLPLTSWEQAREYKLKKKILECVKNEWWSITEFAEVFSDHWLPWKELLKSL